MSFSLLPPGASPAARAAEVDRLVAQGQAALLEGRIEIAGRSAETATRIDPTRREPWLLLCEALSRVGSPDVEKAMAAALRHFGQDDPLRGMLEADRARALLQQRRLSEAEQQARAAAAHPNLPPESRKVLASTLAQLGLYDEALLHAEQALAGLPGDALVNFNLGNIYRYLGRMDDARTAYERAIALSPDESLAHAALASLRKWSAGDNHVDALAAAAARAPDGGEAAPRLRYALFKELNDLGRHDEAWKALAEASALAAGLFTFDLARETRRTQALIEVGPPPPRGGSTDPAPHPIFIFGLPRSGTTLVERILSAHSRVTAMGETTGFEQALKVAQGRPPHAPVDEALIRASAGADWTAVAGRYREFTAYLSAGADCVTDKLPANYEYAGLIHRAFPAAPLVHVRRSPMDSLFGTWRLMFGPGGYPWSYGLDDLAANYRLYRRLMDHWRATLGPAFVEVTLEHLIDRPDQEITALLSRCGLAFEAACLAPESASGGVSTASASQVRTPINRQGVGAWRHYARQLEPLRARLEQDGFVDADGEAIWA